MSHLKRGDGLPAFLCWKNAASPGRQGWSFQSRRLKSHLAEIFHFGLTFELGNLENNSYISRPSACRFVARCVDCVCRLCFIDSLATWVTIFHHNKVRWPCKLRLVSWEEQLNGGIPGDGLEMREKPAVVLAGMRSGRLWWLEGQPVDLTQISLFCKSWTDELRLGHMAVTDLSPAPVGEAFHNKRGVTQQPIWSYLERDTEHPVALTSDIVLGKSPLHDLVQNAVTS